jgi:hypothetical protein
MKTTARSAGLLLSAVLLCAPANGEMCICGTQHKTSVCSELVENAAKSRDFAHYINEYVLPQMSDSHLIVFKNELVCALENNIKKQASAWSWLGTKLLPFGAVILASMGNAIINEQPLAPEGRPSPWGKACLVALLGGTGVFIHTLVCDTAANDCAEHLKLTIDAITKEQEKRARKAQETAWQKREEMEELVKKTVESTVRQLKAEQSA